MDPVYLTDFLWCLGIEAGSKMFVLDIGKGEGGTSSHFFFEGIPPSGVGLEHAVWSAYIGCPQIGRNTSVQNVQKHHT